MAWTRLCETGEIAEGSATVLTVAGVDMLVIRRRGQYVAVTPLCAHMAGALTEGVFAECLEGAAPKCNRHAGGAHSPDDECPGTARSPILQYPTKEIAGVLYADPVRQRISDVQYLSCSPVAGSDGSAALRINLWRSEKWESEEVMETVRAPAGPAPATGKR